MKLLLSLYYAYARTQADVLIKLCFCIHLREGGWVLLQNCHLARSWMPELHKVVECLSNPLECDFQVCSEGGSSSSKEALVHPSFRLFLTSLPVDFFPVSVLQGTLKYALERPKGIS